MTDANHGPQHAANRSFVAARRNRDANRWRTSWAIGRIEGDFDRVAATPARINQVARIALDNTHRHE
jgi:hypothetical protein